ncbi:MAG TPA: universal stress protein [Marmoricola sp.]|nr:universal stress protein [Marmoricola sp.]
MIERILVAVDDSPAGLAATRLALAVATRLGAGVRLVHVVADSYVTSALQESGGPGMAERRTAAAAALFRHVEGLARAAGVEAEPVERYGEPAQEILQEARRWPADLVVIGRGLERGVGGPYVGREARIILEYAEQPVLVVPAPG